MNSVQKGSVRYIVFKEHDIWYAVALEFNIVEEADNPQAALFYLQEAIRGYAESAGKIKGRVNHFLNQKADKEYEDLWAKLNSCGKNPVRSPYQIYSYGVQGLAHV